MYEVYFSFVGADGLFQEGSGAVEDKAHLEKMVRNYEERGCSNIEVDAYDHETDEQWTYSAEEGWVYFEGFHHE